MHRQKRQSVEYDGKTTLQHCADNLQDVMSFLSLKQICQHLRVSRQFREGGVKAIRNIRIVERYVTDLPYPHKMTFEKVLATHGCRRLFSININFSKFKTNERNDYEHLNKLLETNKNIKSLALICPPRETVEIMTERNIKLSALTIWDGKLDYPELRKYFMVCGQDVQCLDLILKDPLLLKEIPKYCPNVRKVWCFGSSTCVNLVSLGQKCKNLTDLELGNFKAYKVADFEFLANLKRLYLSEIQSSDVGAISKYIPNVESLTVQAKLKSQNLNEITENCPRLTQFHTNSSAGVTGIVNVLRKCSKLTHVNVHNCSGRKIFEKLASRKVQLPKLRAFMVNNERVGDDAAQLIPNVMPNVEILAANVGPTGVKTLGARLKRLRVLSLYEPERATFEFLASDKSGFQSLEIVAFALRQAPQAPSAKNKPKKLIGKEENNHKGKIIQYEKTNRGFLRNVEEFGKKRSDITVVKRKKWDEFQLDAY